MIKVCVVKERVDQEVRDLPNRYVEIGKLRKYLLNPSKPVHEVILVSCSLARKTYN